MLTVNLDPDEPCPCCGYPATVELIEIWSSHEFMLGTCCEGLHEWLVREMGADPDFRLSLLRQLGAEIVLGFPLRRVADNDGQLLLDCRLRIGSVRLQDAKRFVARHHGHCRPPVTWRFGATVFNGRFWLGVVMVGNPVAPAYARQGGIVEVNRLCIRRDVPSVLRWNGASKLLGWAAQEAARRGFERIISYTRIDEDGASLRAAGWTPEARVRGRGWHSRRRNRSNSNAWIDKLRWSKHLAVRRHHQQQSPDSTKEQPPCAASMSTAGMTGESASACASACAATRPGSSTTATRPSLSPKDRWDGAEWWWIRP
jgi:hypothetical protein